ncbi:MAG: ATP-binding protein [Gammaproteobacteria bacterium]
MTPANHSIRRRITAWLLVGIGLVLLTMALLLKAILDRRMQSEYDQTLLAKANVLATITTQEDKGVEFDFTDAFMPEFEASQNPEYFQLWGGHDVVLARSSSLAERDLPRFAEWTEGARIADLTLPDGRAGRRVEVDFLPRLDEEVTPGSLEPERVVLVVAREREQLDARLWTLHWILLGTVALVMGLIVLIVRIAVGVGLRPLDEIRTQLAGLGADSLHSRLRPRQRIEELAAMIDQFNALLDRLEVAFQRERQFSSDVAHELRTPLAELRSLAEVGGRWPEDKAMVEGFFQDILAATEQLERIVVNLLMLARCEEGREAIDSAELDLAASSASAWRRVLGQAQAKRLTFHYEGPPSVIVRSARDAFDLILNNLFTNAVAYSPDGDSIRCTVRNGDGSLQLSIANRAEHLTQEDLPKLFDRFWRKDPARTGGQHAGLGLPLVKAYAKLLGLTVSVALEPGQIFRITLTGPADVVPGN